MSLAQVKVVVVGCGKWGANHVREFARLGVLVAVVDIDPKAAETMAGLFNAEIRDWQSTIQDPSITAVVLATPAETHAAMAVEALSAGKHVFVEKPLALSLADGQRVAHAARLSNRIVMVGHLFQYHPAFLKMQTLIRAGNIGNIQHIYSSRLALGRIRHTEDALWSLAPHDLSMILSLAGEGQPQKVTAEASNHLRPDISDAISAHLEFRSGLQAQLSVSWLYPFKERKLVALGNEGMIVFDDAKEWSSKLIIYRHSVRWEGGKPEAVMGATEAVELAPADPLTEEALHFLNCICENRQPRTDLAEGMKVLSLLETIKATMGQERAPQHPCLPKRLSLEDVSSLGTNAHVHETAAIDDGAFIGEGTNIWHFTHVLKGAHIGRNCIVGQNVMIGNDVMIGDRCKIQNNVSVYSGVVLEDGVFCGPSCVFTNVLTPRAEVERKLEMLPTVVRRGATIGANATIVCGIELGTYCMVGAGAVVTKSVSPFALVVGNPSRQIGWVSAAGEHLGPDLVCPRTGERYALKGELKLTLESLDNRQPHANSSVRETLLKPPKDCKSTIPFVDIHAQIASIRPVLERNISAVIDHGNFIMGPEVADLEQRLARFTGAAHVVTCASGTDALTLSLCALGLQRGEAVLVPTFTFVASVEPIALLGGVPIFLDIEPATLTLDPAQITLGVAAARKAGHRPVGIIAVDIFGHPADYEAINQTALKYDLWVIADAAQSLGSGLASGRRTGSLATITTTSFFPSKPLGSFGDGGAVFTDEEALAVKIRSLARHGRSSKSKFDSTYIGMNSRLDTLQAAVLLAKIDVFEQDLRKRSMVAARYSHLITQGTKGCTCRFKIMPPSVTPGVSPAWASYTIRIQPNDNDDRRGLGSCFNGDGSRGNETMRTALQREGIPTIVYYPVLIHNMKPYSSYPTSEAGYPVAEKAVAEVLSLPMNPNLCEELQAKIVNMLLHCAISQDICDGAAS